MHPLLVSLLRLIYPIPVPDRIRDRPLQVLALGLSRSGTDSLRQALLELGYNDVYHGFNYGASPSDALGWIQLSRAQISKDKSRLQAKDFDRILGQCAAVTDIPAAGFADELLDAYPDAKIILNYREDVDDWHRSCKETIEISRKVQTQQQMRGYILSFFQADLFWRFRSMWYVWTRHFDDDFATNGKHWYREHYTRLEGRLLERQYLKWQAEEGWQPLCAFLDHDIPDKPFPHGNVPEQFIKTSRALTADWERQATRNLRIVGTFLMVVAVVFAGIIYDQVLSSAGRY